jgi:Fe-S oxidoreductase
MALCAYCPKLCRHRCPVAVAEASEAATPAAKGALIHMHTAGTLPLAGAVAEAAYRCTNCRLQQQDCLHGIAVQESYHPVRVAAVGAGVAPPRVHSYIDRVRSLGNPFVPNLAEALSGLVGATAVVEPGRLAPTALFPGCTAICRTPDVVRSSLAVLERIHERPRARPDQTPFPTAGSHCCGYPLYAAGDVGGFRDHAQRCARALVGVERLLVLDPGCAFTLGTLYARVGVRLAIEVTTVVEYLHEHLSAVRRAVQAPIDELVAFHDPCHLGRYRGVYVAPRALLTVACGGREPIELSNHHERAWCCGAGGLYPKTAPDGARRIAARRMGEVDETSATVLATSCPSCVRHLGREEAPGRVLDVVALLARALGCCSR